MRIIAFAEIEPGTEATVEYERRDRHKMYIGHRLGLYWPDLETMEQAAQVMLAYIEATQATNREAA